MFFVDNVELRALNEYDLRVRNNYENTFKIGYESFRFSQIVV